MVSADEVVFWRLATWLLYAIVVALCGLGWWRSRNLGFLVLAAGFVVLPLLQSQLLGTQLMRGSTSVQQYGYVAAAFSIARFALLAAGLYLIASRMPPRAEPEA